jgi:hypothetical protein
MHLFVTFVKAVDNKSAQSKKQVMMQQKITYESLLAMGIPIFPVAFSNLVQNINKIILALFARLQKK